MDTRISSSLGILDCTFRDGGYYTNWMFSQDLVDDYLAAMAVLPVDVIELGLAGKGPSAGPFANVDNVKARALRFSKNTMLAVMIDAKDYIEYDGDIGSKLDRDLGPKIKGGIDIIRIAAHYRVTHKCEGLVQLLLNRGYRVFLNLMQIDTADPREIEECLLAVKKIHGLEAVYVADSLGTMKPARVTNLVRNFCEGLGADIGYHAHDNSGLAIANALCAVEAGAAWLDCTVSGMGRGAGNASTEQLLRVVVPEYSKLAEDRLQHLVVKHFNSLKEKCGWGDNLFYQIGAANGLHPTFIQEILDDHSLSGDQVFQLIKNIPTNSASFSRAVLETARQCTLPSQTTQSAQMETVA